MKNSIRPPEWIRRSKVFMPEVKALKHDLRSQTLVTVCEQAKCPNIAECFSRPTATFMVLGSVCTRHCSFCAVEGDSFIKKPARPDPEEPMKLSESVKKMQLKHVVITMVARDDLFDGGAAHLRECVQAIRKTSPETIIEVLTSDFEGKFESLKTLLTPDHNLYTNENGERVPNYRPPDIFNHNLETVKRLQKKVRNNASYLKSLSVLLAAKKINPDIQTKSGLMMGVGETEDEMIQTFKDLLKVGCKMITVGQYLPPGRRYLKLEKYVEPSVFSELEMKALELGFEKAFCGPNVRSSYMADLQTH